MTQVQLRLTVWRPAKLDRRLARASTTAQDWPIGVQDNLYEEVYRWQTREDIWGVVTDSQRCEALRDALIRGFHPDLPPAEREFDKLGVVIQQIQEALRQKHSSWAACEQGIDESDDLAGDQFFRADRLRALARHLHWIHDVFGTVPKACLTIR